MEFAFEYTARCPPHGADGHPQRRVLRGCVVVPSFGAAPFPVVIVAHGYTGFMDWGFFPVLSRELADAGIATIRFNFSGSGIGADRTTMTEPEVFRRNSYLHELEDLEQIHRRIHAGTWSELDPSRLSIVGHSRGGAMAIVHASEAGDYRSVVTWAAIDGILNFTPERLARWRQDGQLDVMHWTARRRLPLDVATLEAAEAARDRLDVRAAAARLGSPVLVVMGDADRSVEFAAGERLAAACQAGQLLRIHGGDHTFGTGHPFREQPGDRIRLVLDKTTAHIAAFSDV